MTDAFLCLGSNMPDARHFLELASRCLSELDGCKLLAASQIYLTEPQNYIAQPWFHNQVLKMGIERRITPADLMTSALAVEKSLGRRRDGPRFGPRPIDIDILLFGGITSADPLCVLPHPRLTERAFALVPLLELAPEITILGQSGRTWLARLAWHQEGDKIFQ